VHDSALVVQVVSPGKILCPVFVRVGESVVGVALGRLACLLPKSRYAPLLEYDEKTPEVVGAKVKNVLAGVKSIEQQAYARSRVEFAQFSGQSIECLQFAVLLVVKAGGGVFNRFAGHGNGHSASGDQFRFENLVGVGDLATGMLGDQALVAMALIEGEQVGSVDGDQVFSSEASRFQSLVANERFDHLHFERFGLLGRKPFQQVIERVGMRRPLRVGASQLIQIVQKTAALAEAAELPSALESKDEDQQPQPDQMLQLIGALTLLARIFQCADPRRKVRKEVVNRNLQLIYVDDFLEAIFCAAARLRFFARVVRTYAFNIFSL